MKPTKKFAITYRIIKLLYFSLMWIVVAEQAKIKKRLMASRVLSPCSCVEKFSIRFFLDEKNHLGIHFLPK